MGNTIRRNKQPDSPALRAEHKAGRVVVASRYHRSPRTVGEDYRISTKKLGTGFNGAVTLAYSRAFPDEKYAVKSLRLNTVSPEVRKGLEAEVEIFLCMDHPHICRLSDVYDQGDFLHLVMECIEGGELFDRITEMKQFSERDAADALFQMLMALNYLHGQGIVHRDLKLENFLYDKPGGTVLKLIDFGFSKIWDPNAKMQMGCGTLGYVAPEVLLKSYTNKCDLWSLGVIAFILISGTMPFFEVPGGEDMAETIIKGEYTMKPELWSKVSQDGVDFVKALLQVDPEKRLSAQQAREHPWIHNRHDISAEVEIDQTVVGALRQFKEASKFRRCCMEMMAWSLTREERQRVSKYFKAIDKDGQGTISLQELKEVLEEKFNISDSETAAIFSSLDSNNDHAIHYSDFLAAMVSHRIALHDELLRKAFNRFDVDQSGFITKDNLREVLGDTFDGVKVGKLLAEADFSHDGQISYDEFVRFVKAGELEEDHEPDISPGTRASLPQRQSLIDREAKGRAQVDPLPPTTPMSSRVLAHGDGCCAGICVIA